MVLVVNSAVGSVLPDIDLETSYIGCRIPILPKFINRVFGHRGFTHSILCMVCCSFLLRIIPWYLEIILFAFCVGYLSHLILDMLNSVGVPLFYPYKKKIRIAWISSDSPIQWVISAGAVFSRDVVVPMDQTDQVAARAIISFDNSIIKCFQRIIIFQLFLK